MKTTQIELADVPSLGGGSLIETALRAIPGVRDVKVQGSVHRVTVEHEDIEAEKLVAAIVATGLAAQAIPDDAEVLSPSVPEMETDPEET